MRYCRHCRKWNAGEPLRCRFCSAGLAGRLCPSGHVNPPDASLAFCGDCGRPLEEKWGAGFSFRPYLLGIGVLIMTLLLAFIVMQTGPTDAPLATALVFLIIVIVGFRLAFHILPPWVGRIVGDAVSLFMHLVLGTGNKGRK